MLRKGWALSAPVEREELRDELREDDMMKSEAGARTLVTERSWTGSSVPGVPGCRWTFFRPSALARSLGAGCRNCARCAAVLPDSARKSTEKRKYGGNAGLGEGATGAVLAIKETLVFGRLTECSYRVIDFRSIQRGAGKGNVKVTNTGDRRNRRNHQLSHAAAYGILAAGP